MNSITSIAGVPEFELQSVHWKGIEYKFWCRVLTAKQAREIRELSIDKSSVNLIKAQQRPEHLVSACVYIDSDPDKETTKPVVEFVDDDGEHHEVVKAWTIKECAAIKDPLIQKLSKICDEVNKTNLLFGRKEEEEAEEDLGNS